MGSAPTKAVKFTLWHPEKMETKVITERFAVNLQSAVILAFVESGFQDPDAVTLDYLSSKWHNSLTNALTNLPDNTAMILRPKVSGVEGKVENMEAVAAIIPGIVKDVVAGQLGAGSLTALTQALVTNMSFTRTEQTISARIVTMNEAGKLDFVKATLSFEVKGCNWQCGCSSCHWEASMFTWSFGSAEDLLNILELHRAICAKQVQQVMEKALLEVRADKWNRFSNLAEEVRRGWEVTESEMVDVR